MRAVLYVVLFCVLMECYRKMDALAGQRATDRLLLIGTAVAVAMFVRGGHPAGAFFIVHEQTIHSVLLAAWVAVIFVGLFNWGCCTWNVGFVLVMLGCWFGYHVLVGWLREPMDWLVFWGMRIRALPTWYLPLVLVGTCTFRREA